MSDMSFFTRNADARAALPLGFIGSLIVGSMFSQEVTAINTAGSAAQVVTVAVPASVDNSTAYSVTINGNTATYTSDGSATQAELGAGLAAAIAAEPGCRGSMTAAYSGGTLTLTGTYAGITHTVTVSGGTGSNILGTPTTSTSAASATSVPFGVAVVQTGFTADGGQTRKGAAPKTSTFTAQVISMTFAGNTASYYSGEVAINGKVYNWGGIVWDTDLDTTCTAIAAGINAVMPTETVIAASVGSGGGVVTLTAEVEGAEFDATARASGHASAEATKAYTTGPSMSTSLARALIGISARSRAVENATLGGDDPAYVGNSAMRVWTEGRVIVSDRSLTITAGDDVYVSVGASTPGYLYNAAGTDRVWVPPSKMRWQTQQSSDGTAVVSVTTGVL